MKIIRLIVSFMLIFLSTVCVAEVRPHFATEVQYRYYSSSAALAACSQHLSLSTYSGFPDCHYENTGNNTGYYVVFYTMPNGGAKFQSASKWTFYNYTIGGSFYSQADAMNKCNSEAQFVLTYFLNNPFSTEPPFFGISNYACTNQSDGTSKYIRLTWVNVQNPPPIGTYRYDYPPVIVMNRPVISSKFYTNQDVVLDGSATDTENGSLSYKIDWYIDNVKYGSGNIVTASFATPGTKTIKAVVSDNSNLGVRSASVSRAITIEQYQNKTALIYVNGMSNFENTDAELSRIAIETNYKQIASALGEIDIVSSQLIFNQPLPTVLNQFIDVIYQKSSELGVTPTDLMASLRDATPDVVNLYSDTRISNLLWKLQSIYREDINKQVVSAIRQHIANKERVLLVGHSQGNFYVNTAYSALTNTEKTHVGILALATPAGYIGMPNVVPSAPGSTVIGDWTTLTNDLAINIVRALSPEGSVLPATIGNSATYADSLEGDLHHGIIEAYLNGDYSGDVIRNQMIDSVKKAVRPQ